MALAKGDEAAYSRCPRHEAPPNTFAPSPSHAARQLPVDAPRRQVVFAVAFYCLCSSSLLFLNKLAVNGSGATPLRPGAVVVVQIAFATAACKALAVLDLADIGALTRPKVEGFGLYAIAFVGSIYASVMALRKSNVETFIVFRASTPLAVAALDYVFLGRSAPSSQALASLIATAVAASAYVATDAQFYVEGFAGYSWCFLYFGLICRGPRGKTWTRPPRDTLFNIERGTPPPDPNKPKLKHKLNFPRRF